MTDDTAPPTPKSVLAVAGTRPQLVKAAAVWRAARDRADISHGLIHTGQHYDPGMSQVFFDELGIPEPDVHLGIGSGGHGAQTGRMLEALERALAERRPDWVLVYGDTNTTLAAALAAAKLALPVAHVEAGLRSFNRRMPEEINRVVTDHVSDLLFAPTGAAVSNLRREGLPDERILNVGDVMYDVALDMGARAAESGVVGELGLVPGGYVVATVHRAENTDDAARLGNIAAALGEIATRTPVVMPLHPRTRARLAAHAIAIPSGVTVTEPMGYLPFTALVRGAGLVATDSGGLQKEAFFHGVPCLTLREETEWVELVRLGWNRLAAPTDAGELAQLMRVALDAPKPHGALDSPYGNGRAADAILDAIAAR